MQSISSTEFTGWMAYYNIEPFGERIADLRMGVATATLANINRGAKQKPYAPEDFMVWVTQEQEPVLFLDGADQARLVAMTVFGIDLSQSKGKGKKFTVKRKRNDS